MISVYQKKHLQFLCLNSKFRKFQNLIDHAINTWEEKIPITKNYGLITKIGKFKVVTKCDIIGGALNGKNILYVEYKNSLKNSCLFDFCAQYYFDLSLEEIRSIIFGFDKKEKYTIKITLNNTAYDFGREVNRIIFVK